MTFVDKLSYFYIAFLLKECYFKGSD